MDERAKRYDMGPVLDSLTVPISCLSGKSKDDIQMFNGLNIFINMAGHWTCPRYGPHPPRMAKYGQL